MYSGVVVFLTSVLWKLVSISAQGIKSTAGQHCHSWNYCKVERPSVSTLLLYYFYAKYESITIYCVNSRLICDFTQKPGKQFNVEAQRYTAPLQSLHEAIGNM